MNLQRVSLFFITFLLVFNSCNMPTSYSEDIGSQYTNENNSIVEETNLFETEESTTGSIKYIFETNNNRFITSEGYTLWSTKYTNESEDFNPFTVRVLKESGQATAGYGVVFCNQTVGEENYMLAVMINCKQEYIIGEVKDGEFIRIISWTFSSILNPGTNTTNTITIDYDESLNRFLLYLNNSEITSFIASETLEFNGSTRGYVTVISPNEKFPNVPVKVTFEE